MTSASILSAIGDTPPVRLRALAPENGAEVWVKLEYLNPTGSMKDRMALAMIEGAERDGLVGPGTTVVEYTGGSTGPAVALVCGARGYRARIVISACFSEERMQLMRALGAEVDVIRAVEARGRVTAKDIQNMVDRAAELAAEPGTYATDQFRNPYVAAGFRDTLGREIWEQTAGRVTAFCHGVGTSGSLMGVAEALRARHAGVRIVALEPAGSPAITGGGPAGSFAMQGWIGSVPPQFDRAAVDDVWTVEDDEAIEMTRSPRARGGHLRRRLEWSERRRRAPPGVGARPRSGCRDARRRQRLQVHDRPAVRTGVVVRRLPRAP
jgi:cysteine synthase A